MLVLALMPILAHAAVDPFFFLSPHIRLSAEERQKMRAGAVLVRVLPAEGRDLAIFAAGPIRIGGDTLISRIKNIVELKKSRYVPAIGRFSDPPRLEDLAALTLEETDLRSLKDCRAGACGLKLGAAEIDQARAAIASAGSGWREAAQNEFRRIVLARVVAYVARGHRALPAYRDRPAPVEPAATFAELMKLSPYLAARAPELAGYLAKYPDAPAAGIESFLYWSKEDFGRKPVVSVTHVAILRGDGGVAGLETLIASKQLFATHYTNAALALTALLRDDNGGRYLAYIYRSRVDMSLWLWRGIVERRIRRDTARIFAAQLERLERGVPAP